MGNYIYDNDFTPPEIRNFLLATTPYDDYDYDYYGNPKEELKSAFQQEMKNSLIIVHLRYLQPQIDYIDVTYSTWDKFANFGGNFGIFAEITGCTFLGMLNFIILVIKLSASRAYVKCRSKSQIMLRHVMKKFKEMKKKKVANKKMKV